MAVTNNQKLSYTLFGAGFLAFALITWFLMQSIMPDEPEPVTVPSTSSPSTEPSAEDIDLMPVPGKTVGGAKGDVRVWKDDMKSEELEKAFGADPAQLPETFTPGKPVTIYTNQGEYQCNFTASGTTCSDSEGPWKRVNSIPLTYGAVSLANEDDFPKGDDNR